MNKLFRIYDFLRYILKSTNQHGIHSPSLFEFYNNVISDEKQFYDFSKIESIRQSYHRNQNEIDIVDYGAGSSYGNKSRKRISIISKQQLSSPYQLRVLYRLLNWVGAQNVRLVMTIKQIIRSRILKIRPNLCFLKCLDFQKHSYHNPEIPCTLSGFLDILSDYPKSFHQETSSHIMAERFSQSLLFGNRPIYFLHF